MFKLDDKYEENEEKYKEIRKTILDEPSDNDSSSGSSESGDEENGKEDDVDEEEAAPTESKLATARRSEKMLRWFFR